MYLIFSTVGVGAIFYVIILVVFKYFVGHYEAGGIEWAPKDIVRVTMTVPPFCFAYHVSFPFFNLSLLLIS